MNYLLNYVIITLFNFIRYDIYIILDIIKPIFENILY